jgi:hypothetical protein
MNNPLGELLLRVIILILTRIASTSATECIRRGKGYTGSDTTTLRFDLSKGPYDCQIRCRESSRCKEFTFVFGQSDNTCHLHLDNGSNGGISLNSYDDVDTVSGKNVTLSLHSPTHTHSGFARLTRHTHT